VEIQHGRPELPCEALWSLEQYPDGRVCSFFLSARDCLLHDGPRSSPAFVRPETARHQIEQCATDRKCTEEDGGNGTR
jgi:hypothetical protein